MGIWKAPLLPAFLLFRIADIVACLECLVSSSKINACFLILGEKAVTPVQLKDFKADLTSQFVFSPPALRSRKKKVSSISRIVEELVSKTFDPFSKDLKRKKPANF